MKVKRHCFWPLILLMMLILSACTTAKLPPLISAANQGQLDEVNQLLGQGMNANIATPQGVTPIFIASAKGYDQIVGRLIDSRASVNAPIQKTYKYEDITVYQGTTPLMAAVANGHTEIVRMLIQAGAYINASNINGATVLMVAATQSDRKIVETLIEKGADIHAKITASYEYQGEPVFKGATALMAALAMKQDANAALLISRGADVNAICENGGGPLIIAAANGDGPMVKYLLSKGADPEARLTEDFTVKGQPAFEGSTALMAAADAGDAESVAALIKAGIDVNAVNKYGATALMAAAAKGRLEAAKVLVAHGADVKARTTERFAIGANPVPKGSTALGGAAYGGYYKVVQFLIDKGADVNAKDDEYDIDALYLAAMKGHIEAVKVLVDNGADVYAETKMGTAHSVALHNGYTYVAAYINDARKKVKEEEKAKEEAKAKAKEKK